MISVNSKEAKVIKLFSKEVCEENTVFTMLLNNPVWPGLS